MARCTHEGICNCDVQGGHGVTVTGRGQPNNPFRLAVDGQALTSQGTGWDPQTGRFFVRVGTSGGLGFDPAGNLITVKEDGSGGAMPGASVTELLKRVPQQNIVGGWHGTGYMIKPQGTRASYTYGVQRGVDLMHVPTRLLTDGTPVVTPAENLTVQNGNGIADYTGGRPTRVVEQTIHRWRLIATRPGVVPDINADGQDGGAAVSDDDPKKGWFGFLEPNEAGLPSLADVFDLVGRSSVLLLDLRFPAITYDGQGNPTWRDYVPTDNQITQFVQRTKVLVQRYGLSQSVIVATATPKVPSTSGEPVDVLSTFTNAAIGAAPLFTTAADANRYPPAKWPSGWVAAFCHHDLDPTLVKTYSDANIATFYYPISRQHQQTDRVKPAGAGGVLSPDPEYYAGQHTGHPTAGNYSYRFNRHRWWFSTVKPGLLPPVETLDTVHPAYRGYAARAKPDQSFVRLGAETNLDSHQKVYSVLQGWCCPIQPSDSYTLDVALSVYGPTGATGQGTQLLFGLASDAPFYGVEREKFGYAINHRVANNGNPMVVRLQAWDPDANNGAGAQINLGGAQNVVNVPNGGFVPLRLRVNTNRLELSQLNPDGTAAWTLDTSTLTAHEAELGRAHRGGYVFLGRESPAPDSSQDIEARFSGPVIQPGSGG